MRKNVFSVDIGGSKILCGVLTLSGEIVESYRSALPQNCTVSTIVDHIKNFYAKCRHYDCFYASVAVPGLCDSENGRWLYSPFSKLCDIEITEIVSEITGLPTVCDNDVNVSALAEKYYGVCPDKDDYIWITVSNGIGGGLVLNGKLYRGANLCAGEIGHFTVEEINGRKCGCGKYGCLEAMASGASISSIYSDLTGEIQSAAEIAERARNGDGVALQVWSDAGTYIGKAIAQSVNLLGTDTVVLGGGAAEAFDLLKPPIDSAIKKHVFLKAVPHVNVLHSALGKNAALVGCAALVKQQMDKEGDCMQCILS